MSSDPKQTQSTEDKFQRSNRENIERFEAENCQTKTAVGAVMNGTSLRYARLYSDGSFNVASDGEDQVAAVAKISGSTDDDDTQLVQVEIRVVASLGYPKLKAVESDPADALVAALKALLACPEIADCDPRDKDPETQVAERAARKAIAEASNT